MVFIVCPHIMRSEPFHAPYRALPKWYMSRGRPRDNARDYCA
jgi:hypothetical protein